MSRTIYLRAIQFVSLYFVISSLWIILSDRLLFSIYPASADLTPIQTLKGLLFITVTSLLLFALILRSTKRLRHSERFLESTIDALSARIAVLDETGRILTTNGAWTRFARHATTALNAAHTGANYLEACDQAVEAGNQKAAEIAARIRTVLSGEQEGFMYEYPCPTPDAKFWFEIRVSRFDDQGITRVVVSHVDITERKRAEQALHEAREQAEETARIKSALLNNMNHEIRTPLTAVLGFADLMARELQGEHQEYAQQIKYGGQRLLQTLDSVFDLSMLEAGSVQLDRVVCDVATEVKEDVETLRPLAVEKNLALHVDPAPSGVYARLDKGAFTRILSNLVGNAIKFTKEGEVRVQVGTEDGQVVLSVQDTGLGIDEAFLPYLFEPFKQESAGLTRTHQGVGLGLTIVKQLVDLHDGRIEVNSQKGVGTTFSVYFPRHAPPPEKANGEVPPLPTSAWARVLVLEDSAAMRFLLKQVLGETSEVLHVATAEKAEEALRLARRYPFDAFILDINLQRAQTGTDVLKELRTFPEYAKAPTIALTAYALSGDQERFLAEGFDAYISKPFDPEQLRKLLVELLYRVPPE
ncbi:MAG TPA: ATP-binding protein [Rhodothermales bacterium]|nr:ATP-binding protein [Rhodothermales bacterium]